MTRKFLFIFLFLSIIFSGFAIFYKTSQWGFSLNPAKQEDLWTIEAHIAFEPLADENIKISLTTPRSDQEYKILEEDVTAKGYKTKKTNNQLILTSSPQEQIQNIYYKALLFDNQSQKGKVWQEAPRTPSIPVLEEDKAQTAKKIIAISKKQQGDEAQKLIHLINQKPIDATVLTFLPQQKSDANTIEALITLLHLQKIPARVARGIKLEENKASLSPDLMLEAYINGSWRTYNLETAKIGIPKDFILFQRGGNSLLDIEGGQNSTIKFSVLKSIGSTFMLAQKRATLIDAKSIFDYSLYNLPLSTQNILKWLSIFPLAILIVVIMRNVIGIQTMGTFTPMLISLSLIKTGFFAGITMFAVMVTIGLLLRALLSKFNLLLVPRISAVVVFVILIMQLFAIIGFGFDIKIAQSSVFFPIIIMAWIIERASITWEEDGPKNALTEISYSILVAIIIYFIIANESIRHIMFAFNELNILILAVIMLLGTYTGYRLTELFRFKSLVEK